MRFQGECAAALVATALSLVGVSHCVLAADAVAGMQKSQACIGCHGPGGSSVNPVVPSLAGQPAQFIATQLVMFREGMRKDVQMSPFAAGLSNADLNNIAAYFAAQKLTPPTDKADASTTAAGMRLAKQFNCVQCHGPALMGLQHIPRLAGQQHEYLKIQLRGFKASTRFDMDGQMTSATQPLSDPDIEILAKYLAGIEQ